MTKKCFKCGKTKSVEMFYRHSQMADGRLGKCKTCTKRDAVRRYYNPESRTRILEYERARNKTAHRKEMRRIYANRMRADNPGRHAAHVAVSNALRGGRLIRKPCEVCGDVKSEAHHEDYRKKLDVRWLCFKHHREAHGQIVGPKI